MIRSLSLDSNNNIYVGTGGNGLYKLSAGSDTPNRIDGNGNYGDIFSIAIDSKENVYFATSSGVFVLKQGTIKPETIDIFRNWFFEKSSNNFIIYFINKLIRCW